jgi:hypothetical protein
MIRNLKRLGPVLAAIAAVAAMAAPAAQAAPEFTAFNSSTFEHPEEASLHATLMESESSSYHIFTIGPGGAPVACSAATFTGTRTAPASATQTVAPTYSGCTGGFGEAAHVAMNGCEYLFHLSTEASEGKYTGTMDLLCPESKGPTLTTTTGSGTNKCVVEIEPDQEGLSTVYFREAKGVMEFEPAVTGVDYFATGGFFNCGMGTTTQTNGKYEGNFTVTASAGESALVFQAVPSALVSAPPTLELKKGKVGTITLTTTGKNKMQISNKPSSVVYNVKTNNCFGKEVPCTIEVECVQENVFAALSSTGLDLTTTLFHAAVSKIECVP